MIAISFGKTANRQVFLQKLPKTYSMFAVKNTGKPLKSPETDFGGLKRRFSKTHFEAA
jgi:hypothetical protein